MSATARQLPGRWDIEAGRSRTRPSAIEFPAAQIAGMKGCGHLVATARRVPPRRPCLQKGLRNKDTRLPAIPLGAGEWHGSLARRLKDCCVAKAEPHGCLSETYERLARLDVRHCELPGRPDESARFDRIQGLLTLNPQVREEHSEGDSSVSGMIEPDMQRPGTRRPGFLGRPDAAESAVQQVNGLGRDLLDLDLRLVDHGPAGTVPADLVIRSPDSYASVGIDHAGAVSDSQVIH